MLLTKLRQLLLTGLLIGGFGCGDAGNKSTDPSNEISVSARDHLNDVLSLMQTNSMHTAKINWTALRSEVFAAVGSAKSIQETYPGIRVALTRLGDGHSSYRGADGTVLFVATRSCVASGAAVPSNLPQDVGYVKVGAFSGTTDQTIAFANNIQNTIRNADRADLSGWIVDLRGNGGGNMWPMIAGLGPVLGDGLLGWFISPVGTETRWEYRNGAALLNSASLATVTAPYVLKNPNPKVAVLVDNGVASSGEATFIAFRKRANARSFGVATCGLSTANSGFLLSDGALLNLAVAVMADRNKTTYGDQVEPDERVVGTVAVVDRAVAWIQTGNP